MPEGDNAAVSRLRFWEGWTLLRASWVPALCIGFIVFFIRMTIGASLPALDWARYSVITAAGPAEPSPELLRKIRPLVYANHKIRNGEWNVWAMARNYGTTVPSLQATNGNELILLSPGQQMLVHNKKGYLYIVKGDDETLDSVVAKHRKDPAQARKLKEKIVQANSLPGTSLLGTYHLARGESLLLPEVQIDFDTYRFPFQAPGWHRISSGFGTRFHPILKYRRPHEGWDLPKPYGTPVYVSRSGKVVYAGWREGYGDMVEVRHADGASTIYGHLSKVMVTGGQWVQRGKSLLGKVGSSGLSTGPHLHFEVRDRNGRAVNPRSKIGRR